MSPRRLLVITYYYPPQPGSGSNRWAAMVKYLRRLGHEVVVLTAAPPGHSPDQSAGVIRTRSLNSNDRLRRLLLRGDRTTDDPAAEATSAGVMPPHLWKGIVPDPWLVTWNPYAWRRAREQIAKRTFDCVITSSPADSTHLLPLGLGDARPAWLADFRDGWCFEPLRPPFPTFAQRRLDAALERRVVTSADLVVGATAPIAADLARRFHIQALHITNGFDPEIEPDSPPREFRAGGLNFVHTGPLMGPRGRDPRPLLVALRRLIDDRPDLAASVRLLVAGRSEFDERSLLKGANLDGVARHLGYLPRARSLGLQRAAKALVLVTSDASSEATGKLYEYLAAGRPVIALARGNEAARIVTETGAGRVVAPDDVDGIVAAFRDAISGELERRYAPRGLESYAYPAPAQQMADAIEVAIAHRALHSASPRAR